MSTNTPQPQEILGADSSVQTTKAVLIKVKNAAELARSQGAVASFAQALAPASIEAKVISTVAAQLKSALRDKGVDADVSVVEPGAYTSAGVSHIASDLGFAIGGAGVAGLIYWLVKRWRK